MSWCVVQVLGEECASHVLHDSTSAMYNVHTSGSTRTCGTYDLLLEHYLVTVLGIV